MRGVDFDMKRNPKAVSTVTKELRALMNLRGDAEYAKYFGNRVRASAMQYALQWFTGERSTPPTEYCRGAATRDEIHDLP